MGYKYDEDEILRAAVELVHASGLSGLTFGALARRIGIADRSIVYYFPTKVDLVTRTVGAIAGELQSALGDAVGDEVVDRDELVRRAWPVLASPTFDPVFAVYFELVGLGAAGIEPYDELAPAVVGGWLEWLTPRVRAAGAGGRRADVEAAVAVLDGLLLLRQVAGPRAANRAARALGIAR